MPVKKLKTQNSKIKTTTQKSKVAVKSLNEKTRKRVTSNLSVPVYSLSGRSSGTMSLPKEIFGAEVNKKLLSQMARVYTNNQKTLTGSTKTRGQVEGSSAKIYRQKGTGRARHGSIRASIFVGGGIVFGPTPRKVILNLPKKMKKSALVSALSDKVAEKKVLGLSGVEKATGKTKEFASLFSKLPDAKKGVLIVTDKKLDNILRAVKNIQGVTVLSTDAVNAYEILKHDLLLLTKEAVAKLTTPKETK